MKIYFTYGTETREGFESRLPCMSRELDAESVEEIQGENILEKVPDLVGFIEECYRLLKKDGKAIFSSPHYGSSNAWASPRTVRAISEASLNFASKSWREQAKYTECIIFADFEVAGSYAVEEECTQRSDLAKGFWMRKYLNVVQAILLTLTKK